MGKHKNNPSTYTWTANDGTEHIILPGMEGVREADLMVLYDLDRLEANADRRSRRHTVSLEVFIDNPDKAGVLIDTEVDIEKSVVESLDRVLIRKALQEAMKALTPAQICLLEQVYGQELPLREIARREGVSGTAIHKRLRTIIKKLKKSF